VEKINQNILLFVLKFINRAIYNKNNEENENLKNQYCVLNSKIINSNYDNTSFIKQFNDH
jgi:hypothetical protein